MVPRARIICIPSFRLSCKGEKLQCSEDTRGFCSRHEHWTRDYRRNEISHAMMPHGHHLCLISSAVWRIFGTEPHVLSFFLSNAHEYSWLISGSLSEMALSFSCDWSFRFSSIPNHVKEIPTLPDCLRTEITIYWIHILFIYFYQEYSKDILYSQCGLQRQPMIDRIMNTYAMSGIRSNVLSSSVKWHGWQLLILTTSFLYQESECCIETSLSK